MITLSTSNKVADKRFLSKTEELRKPLSQQKQMLWLAEMFTSQSDSPKKDTSVFDDASKKPCEWRKAFQRLLLCALKSDLWSAIVTHQLISPQCLYYQCPIWFFGCPAVAKCELTLKPIMNSMIKLALLALGLSVQALVFGAASGDQVTETRLPLPICPPKGQKTLPSDNNEPVVKKENNLLLVSHNLTSVFAWHSNQTIY